METNPQLALYDREEARRRGNEAVTNVGLNADSRWLELGVHIIEQYIKMGARTLTSDDVWARMDSQWQGPTQEPRAMGAVFRKAKDRGLIRRTDRTVTSARTVRHGGDVRVWEVL